jgi:signal transduction histidine kinase
MAVLPFRPTPFFANKNRAFWRLQVLGWSGALLLRAMSSLANGQPLSFLVLILIASLTGFSISLILSVAYRYLITQRPLVTWGVTALLLPVAVGVYAFIDAWVIQLENQATSAQLAMLRYQLNPHFLFNTLNSISTLVLLKQTEPANAMLSRLSSFLRYTLVNEPSARVTVAQEVETLQLYLDIERMRFEDRLRTTFQIDPATLGALLPSLLLQPLVENAIKYAVTPQESGAEITVATQLVGQNLRITVSDTGPGLPIDGQDNRVSGVTFDGGEPVSTGVGLANIRDRLAQAYGEQHRFDTFAPSDGGFAVVIELPFERREPAATVADAPKIAASA